MAPTRTSDLEVAPGVRVPASELKWTAVRASGPGGQNVNRVASKVDLRFDLEHTEVLSPAVKARLRVLARHRLDGEGRVVVTSQRTRDQARNLEDARSKLASLIRRALVAPKPRRPSKPSRAAKRRRVEHKRHRSRIKATRGAVRRGDD